MNRLDGKVCVVTGSTQGLGAAIAQRFAIAGADGLVTMGRNAAKGQAVAAEITKATGVPVEFVRADLGSVEDCRAVLARTGARFGRVDVLVNAGAITDRGTILDTTPELFDRMFATNVKGPFFLMQEAIKLMIAKGVRGSIVNIGSMSEHAGQPFISAYCASKGALATLTRNTAFAVMGNRIRVNQLNIGWMSSDNERALQAREFRRSGLGEEGISRAAVRAADRSGRSRPRGGLHGLGQFRNDDGGSREFRPVGLGCLCRAGPGPRRPDATACLNRGET